MGIRTPLYELPTHYIPTKYVSFNIIKENCLLTRHLRPKVSNYLSSQVLLLDFCSLQSMDKSNSQRSKEMTRHFCLYSIMALLESIILVYKYR